jgi:hypothetical protein
MQLRSYSHLLNIHPIVQANVNIFANPFLHGQKELLPGRLFTARISRDLATDTAVAKSFRQRVKLNRLRVVVILTDPSEYEIYPNSDLEAFYQSLDLKVVVRPISDSNIPNKTALYDDIKDITYHLASGANVLVQCTEGNGRTGMIISSVFRNLG